MRVDLGVLFNKWIILCCVLGGVGCDRSQAFNGVAGDDLGVHEIDVSVDASLTVDLGQENWDPVPDGGLACLTCSAAANPSAPHLPFCVYPTVSSKTSEQLYDAFITCVCQTHCANDCADMCASGPSALTLACAECEYDRCRPETVACFSDIGPKVPMPTVCNAPSDPVLLATFPPQGMGHMAIDAKDLYVGRDAVYRVAKTGGPVQSLGVGYGKVGNLALTTDDVYWTLPWNNAVLVTAKAGGEVRVIADAEVHPDYIAVDHDDVYWTNWTYPGSVRRASLLTGAITTLADQLFLPRPIIVDTDFLYFTANGIYVTAKDGSGLTNIAPTIEPQSLAADETNLYYVINCYPNCAEVGFISKLGGQVTPLATGLSSTYDPVVDDKYLYWAADMQILKIAKDGSSTNFCLVVDEESAIDGFILDDSFIYYSTHQGDVKKIPQ